MPRRRDGGSDNFQGFARAFHYVAAASAVNVKIDETRDDGKAGRFAAARISRYGDFAARADCGDFFAIEENDGVCDFFGGGERAIGENGLDSHRKR